MQNGKPLDTIIVANTTIMLVYDELKDIWVLLNSTDSLTGTILRIVLGRVADALEDVDQSKEDMEQKVNEAIKSIEQHVNDKLTELSEKYDRLLENMSNTILTRPGNLVPMISYFEAVHDATVEIENIENFDGTVDKLLVNYGQTILREGLDYEVHGNGIRLRGDFSLMATDIIQFIVMKQAKP